MSASAAPLSVEAPRDRSIAARRAARIRKFERERLIVDYLNRGVPVAKIAGRIGVTEKRTRALVREILARRMPEAPEEFVAIQANRLNEALLIAYSAMSPDNLKAVALVVRIVRELDRYHGLVDAAAGRASQDVQRDARRSTGHGARPQASARPGTRPEMAPEAIDKMESAPAETAVAGVANAGDGRIGRARRAAPERQGAQGGGVTEPSGGSPVPEPPRAGSRLAPQATGIIDSAPESAGLAESAPVPGRPGRLVAGGHDAVRGRGGLLAGCSAAALQAGPDGVPGRAGGACGPSSRL